MNNDLISREYVERIVKAEFVDPQDGTQEWRIYVNDTCENILDKIHNAPTVPLPDFKEGYKQAIRDGKTNFSRPQGRWIKSKDGYTRCDQCGSRGSAIKAHFCHHCGADMREAVQNDV